MKNIFIFKKYNSFEKLIRITSFELRFIDNVKLKVENKTLVVGKLTVDELNRTKCFLIKGTVMQIEKAQINDCFCVSKVS